jgi:hypothetical protein
MGFRDLKCFNMAMLGKQACRLMTNPTSLCARILKGKYFPFLIYYMQIKESIPHIHGVQFMMENTCCRKALSSGLEMGKTPKSGKIIGFLTGKP